MQFFDSVGLGDLKEETYSRALFQYVCEKPEKAFKGYCGFYAYNTMGPVEFSCHIIENDEGTANEVIGLSMHVMGNEHANLPIGDNGVLDEDEDELSRCVFFETKDGGQIPIRLVMADVLPTYAPGTRVEMQLASFALDVDYYKDADDWQTKRGGELFGKPVSIADGAILSLGTDDTCRIKGRVKRVAEMYTISPKRTEKYTPFLAIYVDTVIGELPIYHTIDMVDTAERDLVRPGSIIDVIAVISGDVAVGEYQGGAIFDEKHLLMLIRDCVECGDWRRLRNVLTDDCEMNDGRGTTADGRMEVMRKLQEFSDATRLRSIRLFGRIARAADGERRVFITCDEPYKRDMPIYTTIAIELDGGCIKSIELLPVSERATKTLRQKVLNEESILRLIKSCIERNDWTDTYDKLADECIYVQKGRGAVENGRTNVIKRLDSVASKCISQNVRVYARMFTIHEYSEDREYDQPIGKRGIIMGYNEPYERAKNYDQLLFIDLDDQGLIKKIYIGSDTYMIKVEKQFEDLESLQEENENNERIPTPDPSDDFGRAFDVAIRHLDHHAKKKCCEPMWIRSHPFPPYIEHLSFLLGSEYFLVLIEAFYKDAEMPGNRRNLIRKARACNARACVMPMVKSGMLMPHMTGYMTVKEIEELEWTPLLSHEGLIDAETGETIDLSQYDCDRDVELTDWELLEFAVSAIRSKLEDEQGRQIMSCQSDPGILPNIWFVGDDGPEWVIVRAVRWPQERAELPANWREGLAGVEKLSRHGNFASVSFASDDRRNSGRILRGKMADLEFLGLEKLTI